MAHDPLFWNYDVLVGTGTTGFADGIATAARFNGAGDACLSADQSTIYLAIILTGFP